MGSREARKLGSLQVFQSASLQASKLPNLPASKPFKVFNMSNPREPIPAKLVVGLFMKDRDLFEPAAVELAAGLGSVDIISSWMPFDYTTYYEPEMGTPLFRRLLTFENLIRQDQLPEIKLTTNLLEQSFAQNGRRRVNIDPGYLLYERFVLATGKNFSHRIYIGSRIYADLTLVYQRGRFQKLDWTFPDYADEPMLQFLTRVRCKYAVDLKAD